MNHNLFKPLLLTMLMLCSFAIQAKEVNVVITTNDGFDNSNGIIETMQQNLSKLLSEINTANNENRELNLSGLDIKIATQKIIKEAWTYVHFYCEDAEVVDRCWPLKNGYMLRHIPFTINPQGSQFGSGAYQECVVEFDEKGQITDFRFAFDTRFYEKMQYYGSVKEQEHRDVIITICDRFRTAFYTKDIKLLNEMFPTNWYKAIELNGNNVRFLKTLSKTFMRISYIDVKFSEIGENGEDSGCGTVIRSASNTNMYGVRFRMEWKSENYYDAGYVFMLLDFTTTDPIIHLCTWQPEYTNGVKLLEEDIYSLSDFDL